MSRKEFSAEVRKQAWKRCGGRCERPGCGIKLQIGKYQYDHIKPDGLEGPPTLENCAVLCFAHHHRKTVEEDRPLMQKADNIRAKHFGFAKTKRPWPKRQDPWGKQRHE